MCTQQLGRVLVFPTDHLSRSLHMQPWPGSHGSIELVVCQCTIPILVMECSSKISDGQVLGGYLGHLAST